MKHLYPRSLFALFIILSFSCSCVKQGTYKTATPADSLRRYKAIVCAVIGTKTYNKMCEGRFDEAFALAECASAIFPDNPFPYYVKGWIYDYRQERDSSVVYLTRSRVLYDSCRNDANVFQSDVMTCDYSPLDLDIMIAYCVQLIDGKDAYRREIGRIRKHYETFDSAFWDAYYDIDVRASFPNNSRQDFIPKW